jgi:hypothetical protein
MGESYPTDNRAGLPEPSSAPAPIAATARPKPKKPRTYLAALRHQSFERAIPFPFLLLDECPALAYANASLFGITMRLVLSFWKSGCQPLPEAESDLAVIARCNLGQWTRYRSQAFDAMAWLAPRLVDHYSVELNKYRRKREVSLAAARKGGQAIKAKWDAIRQAEALERHIPSPRANGLLSEQPSASPFQVPATPMRHADRIGRKAAPPDPAKPRLSDTLKR